MRIAVHGCGSIGLRHIRNLRALGADIEAVDIDEAAFARAAVPWGDGHSAIDAIVIATPASSHRLQACPKPHFVEKPLSTDLISAYSAFRCDEGHAPLIQIGYQYRFDPALAALRSSILDGRFGRVLYVRSEYGHDLRQWRAGRDPLTTPSAQRALGGGILLEASHELDMLCWIFGDLTVHSGWLGNRGDLDIDVEDTAIALLSASDGALIELHLDMVRPERRRRMEVIGSKGCGIWEAEQKRTDAAYVAEMRAFLKSVRSGELHPDAATYDDGLAVLNLVQRIRDAARIELMIQ